MQWLLCVLMNNNNIIPPNINIPLGIIGISDQINFSNYGWGTVTSANVTRHLKNTNMSISLQ